MQAKRVARVCAYLTQEPIEIRVSVDSWDVNTDIDFRAALFALNLFDAPPPEPPYWWAEQRQEEIRQEQLVADTNYEEDIRHARRAAHLDDLADASDSPEEFQSLVNDWDEFWESKRN